MKKEFKKRFDELLKIKETTTAKIGRGKDFEKLIIDVFEDENILLHRSYHTNDNKAEQIDGAIEILNRIILFEVKWVESNLAASDLYAFIGKIDNKLVGTLGLFISKEELSDNFKNAIIKGRKRIVFLLHGQDIDVLFVGEFSLKEYLEYCIRRYSYDNIIHYPCSSFIDKSKSEELSKSESDLSENKIDSIKNILKIIFTDSKVEEYKIDIEIKNLNSEKKGLLTIYLLEKYPKYYDAYISAHYLNRSRNRFDNIKYALTEIIKQKEVTNRIFREYYKLYCNSVNEQYLSDFLWEPFKNNYEKLNKKDIFHRTLYENYKKIKGDYDKENLLTRIIKDIWDNLDKELQHKFLYEYLEIFFSDRKDGYDQKDFAKVLISKKKYKNTFKSWIETKIEEEIKSAALNDEDIGYEVRYFSRHYSDMMYALDFDESTWHEYIRNLYKDTLDNMKKSK